MAMVNVRIKAKNPSTGQTAFGCGCLIEFLVFNAALGWLTFGYCLWALVGKEAPWYVDVICGMILAEITVPLSIVLWLLGACGILAYPLL